MDGYVLALLDFGTELRDQLFHFDQRWRYAAIFNWKRNKSNALCPAEAGLVFQVQFLVLGRSQKGNHNTDALFAPALDFIFKPVAASGTRRNSQGSRSRIRYPIQLGIQVI